MTYDTVTDTADYPPPAGAAGAPASAKGPTVEADIAGLSDKGKVRANNEDNFLVVRFGRFLQTMLTSLPDGQMTPDHQLAGFGMAVADGMGGMAAGEVASRLALTVLVDLVLETPDWLFSHDDAHLDQVVSRAIQRFGRINQSVLEETRRKPWLEGMGTTLTMVCSLGTNLMVAHVGDSPAYLLRGGELHRLTRDHTVAQEMADHDAVPLRDVPSRYRRILTQAIGVRDTGSDPDVRCMTLEDGDRLLLCTDGLTDRIDDETIRGLLGAGDSSEQVCRTLMDLALERGARDNVTVVVASYRFVHGS